ncbi:hypothetical protein J7K41_00755 [Candidatus Micrarchaeota archaeon]|nr:hypothetical protein [Candidatus Micrarchaeota archaeon]
MNKLKRKKGVDVRHGRDVTSRKRPSFAGDVKAERTLSPEKVTEHPVRKHVTPMDTQKDTFSSKNMTTANRAFLISTGSFFVASFSSVFLKNTGFLVGGGLCTLAGFTALGVSVYHLSKVIPKGLGRVFGTVLFGLSELISGMSSLVLGMVASAPLTMSCSPFTGRDLAAAITMLGLGVTSYFVGTKHLKNKVDKNKSTYN